MFLLFAFNINYPVGGADDCIGVFDTLDKAEAAFDGSAEIGQVAVIERGKLVVISNGSGSPHRTPRKISWKRASGWEVATPGTPVVMAV